MKRLSRGHLQVPAVMLVLGTGLAAAVLVGQGWRAAIPVEIVAVIATLGYLLLGVLDTDIGAIYGSRTDERQQMIRLRAQALTAEITALAVVIGYMVQVARRAPTWPFAIIALVAAVSFVAGVAIYRAHDI